MVSCFAIGWGVGAESQFVEEQQHLCFQIVDPRSVEGVSSVTLFGLSGSDDKIGSAENVALINELWYR